MHTEYITYCTIVKWKSDLIQKSEIDGRLYECSIEGIRKSSDKKIGLDLRFESGIERSERTDSIQKIHGVIEYIIQIIHI